MAEENKLVGIFAGIPKFFWWIIALDSLILTIAFVFFVAKSQDMTIETAKTKIHLSGVVVDMTSAANDLQERERQLRQRENDFFKSIENSKVLPVDSIIPDTMPSIDISSIKEKVNNVQQKISKD